MDLRDHGEAFWRDFWDLHEAFCNNVSGVLEDTVPGVLLSLGLL